MEAGDDEAEPIPAVGRVAVGRSKEAPWRLTASAAGLRFAASGSGCPGLYGSGPTARDQLDLGTGGGGWDVGRPVVWWGCRLVPVGRGGREWAAPAREEEASAQAEGGVRHGTRLRFSNRGPNLAF